MRSSYIFVDSGEGRFRELERKAEFPHEIIRKAAELGLLGVPYPEELGGTGLDSLAYAITVEGATPADDPAAAVEQIRPWAEAGATWWIDADWSDTDPAAVRSAAERRLRAGPPAL